MNTTPSAFAVIGAGVIGTSTPGRSPTLTSWILSRSPTWTRPRPRHWPRSTVSEESTSDVEGLLQRGDIDAVTICTPSGIHADLAVAALNAGKHVVVEKPIDVSLAGRRPGHRRGKGVRQSRHRHHPTSLRQIHREGDPGRQGRHPGTDHLSDRLARLVAGSDYYDSGDWRGTWAMDGGGATMNQTVHTIDLLVSILGVPRGVRLHGVPGARTDRGRGHRGRRGEIRLRRTGHHPRHNAPPTRAWTPAYGSTDRKVRRSSPTMI